MEDNKEAGETLPDAFRLPDFVKTTYPERARPFSYSYNSSKVWLGIDLMRAVLLVICMRHSPETTQQRSVTAAVFKPQLLRHARTYVHIIPKPM